LDATIVPATIFLIGRIAEFTKGEKPVKLVDGKLLELLADPVKMPPGDQPKMPRCPNSAYKSAKACQLKPTRRKETQKRIVLR
jgi:hypothetical protein